MSTRQDINFGCAETRSPARLSPEVVNGKSDGSNSVAIPVGAEAQLHASEGAFPRSVDAFLISFRVEGMIGFYADYVDMYLLMCVYLGMYVHPRFLRQYQRPTSLVRFRK